jgi:tRNA A-37 threonylcarbamoyl transferase component Bud32
MKVNEGEINLADLNIEFFYRQLIKKDFTLKEIGHQALSRNKVYFIPESNQILKIYGEVRRWEREVAALNKLKEKDLSVPRLIDYGIHDDKFYWVLMTNVEGQVLNDIIDTFSKQEYFKILRDIGVYHAQYHKQCQVSTFGDWDSKGNIINKYSTYQEFIVNYHQQFIQEILEKDYHDQNFFRLCFQVMDSLAYSISDCDAFTICHNDFSPRNILVEKNNNTWRITGLIDFERSFPADPEFDMTRLLLDLYFKDEKAYYLEGYSSENKLSKTFDDKIVYYLFTKCIHICSWSYKKDFKYYSNAKDMLKKLMD